MGAPENMKGTSAGVGCARIFWMMIAPLGLGLLAFNIAVKGGGWLTIANVAYLAVFALMLAARWLEFRSGQGMTAEGKPLTAAGLRRYLLLAASIGLAVWAGANIIGNGWLAR